MQLIPPLTLEAWSSSEPFTFMLYLIDIDKISKTDVSDKTKKEIDKFIDEYYDRYTGYYLKSKEFLNNIKYSYI